MTDGEQCAPGATSGMQYRRFWSAHVDALEHYLDGMEQSTAGEGSQEKNAAAQSPKGIKERRNEN